MRKQKRHTGGQSPLQTAIDNLLCNLGVRQKMLEYEAVERWSEIVGEHIALNAEAAKIVKGVLTVRTTSAVWRNELHLCKAELIEKINSALGSEIVKDIKFR